MSTESPENREKKTLILQRRAIAARLVDKNFSDEAFLSPEWINHFTADGHEYTVAGELFIVLADANRTRLGPIFGALKGYPDLNIAPDPNLAVKLDNVCLEKILFLIRQALSDKPVVLLRATSNGAIEKISWPRHVKFASKNLAAERFGVGFEEYFENRQLSATIDEQTIKFIDEFGQLRSNLGLIFEFTEPLVDLEPLKRIDGLKEMLQGASFAVDDAGGASFDWARIVDLLGKRAKWIKVDHAFFQCFSQIDGPAGPKVIRKRLRGHLKQTRKYGNNDVVVEGVEGAHHRPFLKDILQNSSRQQHFLIQGHDVHLLVRESEVPLVPSGNNEQANKPESDKHNNESSQSKSQPYLPSKGIIRITIEFFHGKGKEAIFFFKCACSNCCRGGRNTSFFFKTI